MRFSFSKREFDSPWDDHIVHSSSWSGSKILNLKTGVRTSYGLPSYAVVAHSAEQMNHNHRVVGSNPTHGTTNFIYSGVRVWTEQETITVRWEQNTLNARKELFHIGNGLRMGITHMMVCTQKGKYTVLAHYAKPKHTMASILQLFKREEDNRQMQTITICCGHPLL